MSQVKKETLILSKYFLTLPHPAKTTLMILAAAFLFGVLFGVARQQATGAAGLFAAGIDGVFLLAFPALLSAVGLFIMRRKAIFRRSVFLGLLTVLVYGLLYLASPFSR